ncbi:DNA methyltransferase [Elizabethkingia anophelis]|uniref:DNA methyltransferase n=1 Tax=Elizabethkingia anophelis TaxID=1117645 RepID=UPI003786FC60
MNITDKITITNEDNMELMARYPDGYFDLAIVDPPYGSSIMQKNKKQSHKTTDTSYRNKTIPSLEYFKELERVSKRSIIFGCQYMLQFMNPKGSFIIWDKGADPDLHNMSSCDVAWYSERKQIKKYYAHWCGAVKCEKEPTIHIHQKPVKIYKWLLDNYALPGDKILDTHLGSGSIAIACHDFGYELTACEIDNIYFHSACKRIKHHIAFNQSLFQPEELTQTLF